MYKWILLVITAFLFTACTVPMTTYNYDVKTKEVQFKIKKDETYTLKMNNPKYTYTLDECVNDGYLLQNDSYFVENISLDTNCKWNGLARGYFIYDFKEKLKLDSMKKVERIKVSNYEFSTYKINNDSILNLVYVYNTFQDTFILDYDGVLYKTLLKKLKPDYVYKYDGMKRFKSDYHESLVRKNFINYYFSKDGGDELSSK